MFSVSPDDGFLAVTAPTEDPTPSVYLIDTRSMTIAHTIDQPFSANVSWSPDSRWMFFGDGESCFAFDPTSGQRRDLGFSCGNGAQIAAR